MNSKLAVSGLDQREGQHCSETNAVERAPGVLLRTVIGTIDKAPNLAMRVISLAPRVVPSFHSHPWEHEVFLLSGAGQIRVSEEVYELGEGSVIFTEANEPHESSNVGDKPFTFICLVPIEASEQPYRQET